MQKMANTCVADDCDATHKSWEKWEVTCVNCGVFVCRSDYKQLPIVEMFMTRTRECPECTQPMEA